MADERFEQDPLLPADARLERLDQRVAEAQRREEARAGRAAPTDAGDQLGQRVLATLIGGILGGTLIGWVLDRLFGTWPILFITLLVLGTASGFWSIINMSSKSNVKEDR